MRFAPLFALACALLFGPAADASEITVGVSWSNFQEERWKTDEAALVAELERQGAEYVSADAQSSPEKQASDLETLVARGADVLVVLAQDADALVPAIRAAQREGIPVLAYDRLIELPGILYMSFDNREVGRIQAREVLRAVPSGRFAFIKGSPQDPNSHFVHAGQLDVLNAAIARGDVRVVGDQFVDRWMPEVAQRVMEQILTANRDGVDAVVCSNDGMASGVVAALSAQGLAGIPVSGQDGDHAALNRIALGTQTVSVWKDSRELGRRAARAAVALARSGESANVEGAARWDRGPRGVALHAILLEPVAITRANLAAVIDAGWVPRETVCRGVAIDADVSACR